MSAFPRWASRIASARNATGPGMVAVCQDLLEYEETPPVLREIATRVLEERLYRADRPRARTNDPQTSQDAAETVRGPMPAGGKGHRVLRVYADHARFGVGREREVGLTSREVEGKDRGMRGAHKRTSELLDDGLLRLVTRREKIEAEFSAAGKDYPGDEHFDAPSLDEPAVRGGGRILRITPDGERELARLDAALRVKNEKIAEREARSAAYAERRRKAQEKRDARAARAAGGSVAG